MQCIRIGYAWVNEDDFFSFTGIIRAPSTREDEIHNCQLVIDSLAGDVLHTSLTHISGADIIDSSREAILNLAEIFAGLLEYMLNKIDSDASTDNEGICRSR